jgi:alginate O-acetyltransferase complex protein AlgI
MLFNSLDYLNFFVAVVWLYFVLSHRYRVWLLLAASYVFYMWWKPSYAVLILASTLVDYLAGLRIAATSSAQSRRAWLWFSLVTNLGMLFTFKYWGFFWRGVEDLGVPIAMPALDVLLPIGISFYTFQSLAYTIDVYRNEQEPERHFGRFALYVAFFPQLVAGPIERASRLLPQIDREKQLDWARVGSGLQRICWGLFKKMVIADRLAIYVDSIWADPSGHGAAAHLLAAYAFTFQIYCDFSGYTDIAIGSARVLGFDLVENFRRPFFAASTREFWRRWHISLSTWLRDYLYVSLGGSRRGITRTYANLLITMLLGGLWHGASWTFVLWGAVHGLLLVAGRASEGLRDALWHRLGALEVLRRPLGIAITFHIVVAAFAIFRAPAVADLWRALEAAASGWGSAAIDPTVLAPAALGLVVLVVVQLLQESDRLEPLYRALPRPVRWSTWYAVVFVTVALGVTDANQFIYFRF